MAKDQTSPRVPLEEQREEIGETTDLAPLLDPLVARTAMRAEVTSYYSARLSLLFFNLARPIHNFEIQTPNKSYESSNGFVLTRSMHPGTLINHTNYLTESQILKCPFDTNL